jgi:Protein of unknown function (DUF3099)
MYARRRLAYFSLMGACLTLFVSAWAFVRLWSVAAAVAMCVIAMVIPPCAAIIANRRGPEDRWWDEPGGSEQYERSGGPRRARRFRLFRRSAPPDRPGDSAGADRTGSGGTGPGPGKAVGTGKVPGAGKSRAAKDTGDSGSCGDEESDRWWRELDQRYRH